MKFLILIWSFFALLSTLEYLVLFCGFDPIERIMHLWRFQTRPFVHIGSRLDNFLPFLLAIVVATISNLRIKSLNAYLLPIIGLERMRIGSFCGVFSKLSWTWVHYFILQVLIKQIDT